MKKPRLFLKCLTLCGLMSVMSCGSGENTSSDVTVEAVTGEEKVESSIVEYDLSEKGIPVTVQGPSGAEIKKGSMTGAMSQSWEVSSGNFKLEVDMDDEDVEQSIAEYIVVDKETSTTDDSFVEIVKEEEAGYIYKNEFEGDISYDFYYVIIKDNKAIEFTTGLNLLSDYSLEDVEVMYNAAKNAK